MAIVATSEDLEIGKKDNMSANENEKVEMKETVPNGGESKPETAETPETQEEPKTEKETKKSGSKILTGLGFFHRDKSGERKKKGKGSEDKDAETPKSPEDPDAKGDEATELLIKDDENGEVKIEQPKNGPKRAVRSLKWIKIKRTKKTKEPKSTNNDEIIDMLRRDEKPINPEIALTFDDVFGEPADQHSVNCNWRAAHWVFGRGRGVCYKLLTLPFAIPLALLWAFVFAFLSCLHVWAVRPGGRGLSVLFGWIFGAWAFLVRSVCDPVFLSLGMCYKQKKTKISTPIVEMA